MAVYDDQSETVVAHTAARSTGKAQNPKANQNTGGRRKHTTVEGRDAISNTRGPVLI